MWIAQTTILMQALCDTPGDFHMEKTVKLVCFCFFVFSSLFLLLSLFSFIKYLWCIHNFLFSPVPTLHHLQILKKKKKVWVHLWPWQIVQVWLVHKKSRMQKNLIKVFQCQNLKVEANNTLDIYCWSLLFKFWVM